MARACIRHRQRFAIVRSKSDEIINRISDDDGLDGSAAKQKHQELTAEALREELQRAGLTQEQIIGLAEFCVLVNKKDLYQLVTQDVRQWPEVAGKTEIHERRLLSFLGKKQRVSLIEGE